MNNFSIEKDGKTYWISRSCASVAVVLYGDYNKDLYVLATKRGKNAADFHGYWCMPCGYIDYNETGEEAASRETFEETGVKINPSAFRLVGVNTNPESNKQNISLRYLTVGNNYSIIKTLTTKHNAVIDEVEEVRLIDVKTLNNYKWCFGHNYIINDYVDKLYDSKYCSVNDIRLNMF